MHLVSLSCFYFIVSNKNSLCFIMMFKTLSKPSQTFSMSFLFCVNLKKKKSYWFTIPF